MKLKKLRDTSNKYVLKRHPEFLRRYPHGTTISAFKNIVAGQASIKPAPVPAASASSTLTRVRPHIRILISRINGLFLISFDKQITPSENKFWVDYVYQGEVNNEADLIEAMKTAKQISRNPARTPRRPPRLGPRRRRGEARRGCTPSEAAAGAAENE